MATATGRLMIVLQGAVQELEFTDDKEREDFLTELADSFPERLRQSLLTWQSNRRTAKPDPTKPVPDHIQRERDRVAAKRQRA